MQPPRLAIPALAAILALSGCADFPDLGDTAPIPTGRGAYPALMPLDALLAEAQAGPAPVLSDPLAARAAALRARAAGLQAPVIDPATMARLKAASGG